MKPIAAFAAGAALLLAPIASAQVIATWTFETSQPASAGPHAAEEGLAAAASFASGLHASAATVYSSPVGNGSPRSFSSNNWSVGDYYQFEVAVGAAGPLAITPGSYFTVTFDQTRSSTGPADFTLWVSTNGADFASLGSYTVNQITWSSTAANPSSTFAFGSLPTTGNLVAASTLWFRLQADAAGSASAGTNRVDNFSVALVPEPSTYAVFVGAAALLVVLARRRLR